uniref:putative F-box/LRR-repeat protein At5g02930 n=1 Tax=Erigeron canadensis TaxID=72917 RepID=UPI001CB93789|nr:putative F-box/LRR-repeat protein At5g02930 [Erigeron canadensis]
MDLGHNCKKRKSDDIEEGSAAADILDSKKIKKEKPIDRLSSLPDDLIHKILSFVGIEDAVRTMVLSSRYRFIWTAMPCLDFSTLECLRRAPDTLGKFVRQFLKRRDSRTDVSSLKLTFRICGKDKEAYVRNLMDAFSHKIQRLEVVCLFENTVVPLSFFSSPSLKHLSLETRPRIYILTPKSTWELPSLTTLYLKDVRFCSDDKFVVLLSKCPNLKNLTIESCETYERNNSGLSICHPGLSDLTLYFRHYPRANLVNVVAPQLENLTIADRFRDTRHEISAPKLASLAYEGSYPLLLNSTDGFPCLKEAHILVSCPNAHQIVCMLQQLHTVEFLKLNFDIIELLSSSVELISHQPSPFVNLKSLTIYPEKISPWETKGPKGKVDLSSEVKSYFLDSSPGATFTMFSREEEGCMEVIAVRGFALARRLMGELQVLLEQEKASTKTKRKVRMDSDNAKMRRKRNGKAETKMQLQIGENIALIKSCSNKLNLQSKQQKAHLVISKLDSIEGLLKKLHATNRAMIEPFFNSLFTEAVIVMRKMTEDIKIECDENQKRLIVGFH